MPPAPLPKAAPAPDASAYEWLDVAVAVTDAQGRLLVANQAFLQCTGWSADGAVGLPLTEVLGLRDPMAQAWVQLARRAEPFSGMALEGLTRGGRPLCGAIGMRCHDGHARVFTLQPSAPTVVWPPAPHPVERPDGALPRSVQVEDVQAQLRLAVDLAGITVWRHDLATHWVEVNAQGWAVLGLDARPEGLTSQAVRERIHPDDLGEVLRLSRQASVQRGPVDIGARYLRSDGRWRYVLTRTVAQRGPDGKTAALLGVSLDLSERFEQTQRTSELARRLEMATSAAGVAIWSHQTTGTEVHWDAQMRRLHGAIAGQPVPDLATYLAQHVHPEDRSAVADGMNMLIRRRSGLLDLDFRIRRTDGTERRVASRTSVETTDGRQMLHGVMLDVTERHAAEARLREADERIALATRGAGIGTWELSLEHDFVWWDEQMFRLRGLEPAPVPIRREDSLRHLHPDDRDPIDRTIALPLAEGETANYEFRVVWPDGRVRWLASRSTAMRDEPGGPLRRIGINWDVTDVRAAAAERQEKLLARRESQAKSQFLARMSHELRTPLNAVLGFAQLLMVDGERIDADTARQRVRHIQSAGEHLLELINEVLDLSSLESGELPLQLSALPLDAVVAEVLPLVENLAVRHGVTLCTDALAHTVHADPTRLRQVLINLLSNAVKYNRRGGRVSVESGAEGPQVVLRVRDTGRGMTEEQLRHLFEPFNRLGVAGEGIEGTGIGLAIMRAAVLHMGGTVQVSSQPGVGSCFEVRLAAADAPLPGSGAAALPPAAPAQPPSPRARGVLYIEDNAVNMLIVGELIGRRADLAFHGATDGHSGVALALQTRPDLVLVDMQLPDIDGIEVLRRLRAERVMDGIRCVALSANAMPADIQRALEAGFDAYWTKPLDFAAFMAELDAQFGPAPAP
ncbi:hybrid sensor histidine kinase/response regulator [Ideonella sp. A 288]|uniref:hybrid sensor histidine kinase/response regulator n=1 Tax=Ideonella sp. A 288 TaxID=1962181 RepID=UPI000B4C1AAB|nr:hybrid sensor histidine kinase/response regulator [Ideonella sp. A 288]